MNWKDINIDDVVDKSKVIPRFLCYYLKSPAFELIMNARGGFPSLYSERSGGIKSQISLPPLKEQKRIVFILSAYDSLLANNIRRIELLENAVKEYYNHWFLYLQFPGHQKVPIEDGVPRGWEKRRLSELVESAECGYTASSEKSPLGPKLLQIKDILSGQIDWSEVQYCKIVKSKFDKYRLKTGDIVVARNGVRAGYARRIHKKCPPAVCTSFFVRFRIRQADDIYIGCFMESGAFREYLKLYISPSAQVNTNIKIMGSIKVLIPPRDVQKKFRRILEPMLDQISVLLDMNHKLKTARELLLPGLFQETLPVGGR